MQPSRAQHIKRRPGSLDRASVIGCSRKERQAGLVASGTTIVRDIHHVDRGYAGFVDRLQGLGVDVERVAEDQVESHLRDA